MTAGLPGVIPSPNIWRHPATYELENRAVDPDDRLWSAMTRRHPLGGQRVVDIGCGTGYYLPRFAAEVGGIPGGVVGVEPHDGLRRAAVRRIAGLRHAAVRSGVAAALPLADASVDVAHARWAYFFGPGCEPGLAELDRVMRGGGTAFIIDNDVTRSTFGTWCRRTWGSGYRPREVEAFFSGRGWQREPVDMGWRFERRADLEAVIRIEFPRDLAEAFIAEHDGLEVDYAVNMWWRRF